VNKVVAINAKPHNIELPGIICMVAMSFADAPAQKTERGWSYHASRHSLLECVSRRSSVRVSGLGSCRLRVLDEPIVSGITLSRTP
jgi:hypothetical protein